MIGNALLILRHEGALGLAQSTYGLLRLTVAARTGRRYLRRRVHDYQMELDALDRGISRSLMLFGQREKEHRLILNRALKPGMTVFDIGANIGYYALMESRIVGKNGRVVAIEPSPDNIALLQRNLALNGVENITVRQGAVSDRPDTRQFFLAEQSNLHTFHPEGSAASQLSGTTIDVETTTVPDLAAEFGPPDLMRMDVEGHEVEVLNGMLEAVERGAMAPMILFETHLTRYGPEHDLETPLRRLFACGYRARLVASSQESGSARIEALGYRGGPRFKTDMVTRVIFENLSDDHTVDLVCRDGGIRALLLAREH